MQNDNLKHILFLTCNGIEDAAFGGAKASIRNYELLKKYGTVDVVPIQKRSNLASALSVLQGYFPPAGRKDLTNVKKKLREGSYTHVFFDGSCFGTIEKYVKQEGTSTICFFHNCEYDYIEVRFGAQESLKKRIYRRLIARQERLAAQYADCSITFTKRDAERIHELYGVRLPAVVPLSLPDIYKEHHKQRQEKICLLFGPVGQANVEAFAWFVTNVSPYLSCKTLVAGKGFEAYREKWTSDKVAVQGYVEDVSALYGEADCVAIPLLSGGGMKIKTAEALMFGKAIFGTDEAFVGYELDREKVGGCCNSASEFIGKINRCLAEEPEPFHPYARQCYEERYSLAASEKAFGALLG